jgi:hypothetical protein
MTALRHGLSGRMLAPKILHGSFSVRSTFMLKLALHDSCLKMFVFVLLIDILSLKSGMNCTAPYPRNGDRVLHMIAMLDIALVISPDVMPHAQTALL